MKRKVLIISNPGVLGKDNYCEGVNKDVENYISFLKSPIGGLWSADEISHLHKPSKLLYTCELILNDTLNLDFFLFIFVGHGYYDATIVDTMLSINDKKEEAIASNTIRSASKQLIILDCCRVIQKKLLIEQLLVKAALSLEQRKDPTLYKTMYNAHISMCSSQTIVVNSCAIGEEAGDDSELGGYYSYLLLRQAHEWASPSMGAQILTIPSAHESAAQQVVYRSRGEQNPKIQKPRTGPYLPIAVKI